MELWSEKIWAARDTPSKQHNHDNNILTCVGDVVALFPPVVCEARLENQLLGMTIQS